MKKDLILLAISTALITGNEVEIRFVKLNGDPRIVQGKVELHTVTGEVLVRTSDGEIKTIKPERVTSINRA